MSAPRLRDLARRDRAIALGGLLLLLASGAVLIWRLRTGDWTQVGDEANQINGAQFALREHPLLGDLNTANLYGNPISHHPGPIAWYLLAPWVLVLGPQLGAWTFGVLWNVANLAACGVLAHRTAGPRAAAMAVPLLGLLYVWELPGLFASTFFQFSSLLPFATTLVACWAVSRGDRWALPIGAVTGTYVVQTASIQLPVIALVALAAVACAWRTAEAPRRELAGPLVVTLGIGTVLWFPALYDQVLGTGNLGKLARIEVDHAGLDGALDALRYPWSVATSGAPILLVLVLVIAVVGVGRARRFGRATDLAVVAAIVLGTLVAGGLLPADDVEATHLHWVVLALGVVVLIAWSAAVEHAELPRPIAIAAWVAFASALATLAPLVAHPRAETIRDRQTMLAVLDLDDRVRTWPDAPLLVFPRGGWSAVRAAQGLSPLLYDRVGSTRTAGGAPPPGEVLLVAVPPLEQPGDAVELARSGPHGGPAVDPDLADEVARWSRANGPLVLRPAAATVLPAMVDGRTEAACIEDLLAEPDDLLDLGPDVAIRLYAEGLVASPALPPELDGQLLPWLARQPAAVYRLTVPEPGPDDPPPDDLLLTRSSC